MMIIINRNSGISNRSKAFHYPGLSLCFAELRILENPMHYGAELKFRSYGSTSCLPCSEVAAALGDLKQDFLREAQLLS